MGLADLLGFSPGLRPAIAAGLGVALLAVLIVTPKAARKLMGAGITGRDRHKPDRPEIPEMGGLAVFLAFNAGVFTSLAVGGIPDAQETLLLASLIVAAGACVTGVLDDLIELRRRFKAFIPFAFAIPLALYVPDSVVAIPLLGPTDFGIAYHALLVPLGVACASNGFNMLEGFNGLGAGLGIVLGGAISVLAILEGNLAGLVLLFPLIGALAGFLLFNFYPARIFPGDTLTLTVGAVLAAAAILSKVEFWAALLFVPHVVEFLLKMGGGFRVQSFATRLEETVLVYEGPTRSLTHLAMKSGPFPEGELVVRMWVYEGVYAAVVVGLYVLASP